MAFKIIGEKPNGSFSVITVGNGDINAAETGCVELRLVSVKKQDECTDFIYFSKGFDESETKKLN